MKNYTQSPYSQALFSDMSSDKLESAYSHFICLLSIALSKKYNVDTESLVKNNFSKLDISSMGRDMLNDFIKDCEGYIKYIQAVCQIKDTNMTERVNALSNMIDEVLPADIKEKEFFIKVKDLQKKDGLFLGTGSFNFEHDRENEKQSLDIIEDDTNDFELSDDELVASEDGNVYM